MLPRVIVTALAFLLFAIAGRLQAQTTQALVSGKVLDLYTGNTIDGAEVLFTEVDSGTSGTARSDSSGIYVLPLLSPGTYRIRAAAKSYQAQELHELRI